MNLRQTDPEKLSDRQLKSQLKWALRIYKTMWGGEKGARNWAATEPLRAELRRRGLEVDFDIDRAEWEAKQRAELDRLDAKLAELDAQPKAAHLSPFRGTLFGRPKCIHCRKGVKFGSTHCHHCGRLWSQ
jgi:hypothetical protein